MRRQEPIPNERLRAARRARCWTLAHAAERAGVSLEAYSRWEYGVQEPRLGSLLLLCEAFGTTAEELGFGHLVTPTLPRGHPPLVSLRFTDEQVGALIALLQGDHLMRFDPTRRRLLQDILTAAGMASLPLTGLKTEGAIGISDMLAPIQDGVFSDLLAHLTAIRAVLVSQDNRLGPRAAAPVALHQMGLLNSIAKGTSGRSRAAVLRLQATFAEFTGWLYDDLGDRCAGEYWTDRSLEWSHELDDERMVGYVLMRKAQRAAEAQAASVAVGLAQAAQRRKGITPRMRAGAAGYEALGHALARDRRAFEAAIQHARDVVLAAPPVEPGMMWSARWCTPGYIDVYEAAAWMALGEPGKAVEGYERALTTWSGDFLRDHGIYVARLARAHAAARQPEQAAEVGRKALALAGTGSARLAGELHPLAGELTPWESVPPVQAFMAELRQTVPTQFTGEGRVHVDPSR